MSKRKLALDSDAVSRDESTADEKVPSDLKVMDKNSSAGVFSESAVVTLLILAFLSPVVEDVKAEDIAAVDMIATEADQVLKDAGVVVAAACAEKLSNIQECSSLFCG